MTRWFAKFLSSLPDTIATKCMSYCYFNIMKWHDYGFSMIYGWDKNLHRILISDKKDIQNLWMETGIPVWFHCLFPDLLRKKTVNDEDIDKVSDRYGSLFFTRVRRSFWYQNLMMNIWFWWWSAPVWWIFPDSSLKDPSSDISEKESPNRFPAKTFIHQNVWLCDRNWYDKNISPENLFVEILMSLRVDYYWWRK